MQNDQNGYSYVVAADIIRGHDEDARLKYNCVDTDILSIYSISRRNLNCRYLKTKQDAKLPTVFSVLKMFH